MKAASLLFLLLVPLLSHGQMKVKWFMSRDTILAARVTTVQTEAGGNIESSVEVGTMKGKRLAIENFISKDRQHGLGVLKAEWTFDSEFFVFSMIASGGREPGHFPTYFYSRPDNKFYLLDTLIKVRITDPEFYIDPPDVVLVTGRDVRENGAYTDTLQRAAHLGDLIRPSSN